MMKIFAFFILTIVVFESRGSFLPEGEADLRPFNLFHGLHRVASKCLRMEEGEATAADREFLETAGAAADSLLNPMSDALGAATMRKKKNRNTKKRVEGSAGDAGEVDSHRKRQRTIGETMITQDMKDALGELAGSKESKKITIADARRQLGERYPALAAELGHPKSNLSNAVSSYLTRQDLLKRVRGSGERRLTEEMMGALQVFAGLKESGKITIADARRQLGERYPALAAELDKPSSNLFNAVYSYVRHSDLLERVQGPEQQILTPEMKGSLQEFSGLKENGKITIADARRQLGEQYPELASDLEDSQSNLSNAVYKYLTRQDLLEKVQGPEQQILTPEMKRSLQEFSGLKENGKITIADARKQLGERYPALAAELDHPKSNLSKAVYSYARYNDLLERVQGLTEEISRAHP